MIARLLGEPDQERVNPRYRSAAPMKRYLQSRVLEAEQSEQFRDWQSRTASSRAKISAASQAAVTARRERLLAYVAALEIKIAVYPLPVLQAKAFAHYNALWTSRGNFEKRATGDIQDAFAHRIMVNFLRHECSHYDAHLAETFGKTGREEAIELIRGKVLDTIADAYPDLAFEAYRQSSDDRGGLQG